MYCQCELCVQWYINPVILSVAKDLAEDLAESGRNALFSFMWYLLYKCDISDLIFNFSYQYMLLSDYRPVHILRDGEEGGRGG